MKKKQNPLIEMPSKIFFPACGGTEKSIRAICTARALTQTRLSELSKKVPKIQENSSKQENLSSRTVSILGFVLLKLIFVPLEVGKIDSKYLENKMRSFGRNIGDNRQKNLRDKTIWLPKKISLSNFVHGQAVDCWILAQKHV